MARNRRTPKVLLASLVFHPLPWVAASAGGNPSTPVAALTVAALAGRAGVAEQMVANPRLPVPVLLWLLAKYGYTPQVRHGVVRHPNATPTVWEAVLEHPKVDEYALTRIAGMGNLPERLYHRIAVHPALAERDWRGGTALIALAENPHCPAAALTHLAHACDVPAVLEAVAAHPNTPEADATVAALRTLTA